MKFNNCKPQPGISSLRAKFREMRAENLNAVFPHMGGKPQKYRTKNLLTEDSRKSTIVFTFSFSYLCIRSSQKILKTRIRYPQTGIYQD